MQHLHHEPIISAADLTISANGRLLFLCIASVQQLGPAPFRAPASSIVTPDNYSSCPARAPGQKNAAMYVHKSCAQSKISKSLHQH